MPKIVFSNGVPVKILRNSFNDEPIVYQWWFSEIPDIMKDSQWKLDFNRIKQRTINDKTYYLLYVGIGSHCVQRFNWHISQHHSQSIVKSGFLSTLRKSLCAILEIDMSTSKAEKDVNKLMDTCYLEWNIYPGKPKHDLETIETNLLKEGYYPLNIDKNPNVPEEWLTKLKELRKSHKK